MGPLLVLILGTTDFVLGLLVKNSMQYAAREGCRYAITAQTISGSGQIASIKTVTQNSSLGFLPDQTKIFVRFYNRSTLSQNSAIGANSPGNVVKVSIEGFQWNWLFLQALTIPALTVNVAAMDVMEPSQNSTPPTL